MDTVWDHFIKLHAEVIYTSIMMFRGLYVCRAPRILGKGGRGGTY